MKIRSKDHEVTVSGIGTYMLSWTVKYQFHTTAEWPAKFNRETNLEGARKFAKKHGVPMPTGTFWGGEFRVEEDGSITKTDLWYRRAILGQMDREDASEEAA